MTMSNNRRALVAFVVLALLTAFVVIFATQREANAADGYSTDPENPTLVEEVPEGFTALGDPTSVTEDCITTTEQVYSRTTSGSEASYTEWTEWAETQSGLLTEPTVPANTDVHEWQVTGPVKVIDSPATDGYFTEWANDGAPIRTEENVAPGANTDTVRYTGPTETDAEVVTPAKPGQHYSWNGGNRGVDDPPLGDVPPGDNWTLQGTGFDPHLQGEGDPATWFPVDPATSGLHVTGNSPSNASWFYYVPGTDAVTDTDWLWQKQVREWVPGQGEQSHNEWAVEERTRTFIPAGEDVTEYVYTSVTTGEPCEPEEPENPEEPDTPDEPKQPEPPKQVKNPPAVPTSIDAGL